MNKNIVKLSDPEISMQSLLSNLQLGEDDEYIDEISILRGEAMEIAKPVAIYSLVTPEIIDGTIKLNGIEIKEPFVNKMLSDFDIVIPYVASCGTEIDEWSKKYTDFFDQFVADTLKQLFLALVREELFAEVKEKYLSAGKHLSTINPGSLEEWPITGQIPLFKILGGVKNDIGVTLMDSLLMSPTKSVSGIMFMSEEAYHNCQLCPKENCPGRCAPYIGD